MVEQLKGKEIHRKTWMATAIFPMVIYFTLTSGMQKQLKYTKEREGHIPSLSIWKDG